MMSEIGRLSRYLRIKSFEFDSFRHATASKRDLLVYISSSNGKYSRVNVSGFCEKFLTSYIMFCIAISTEAVIESIKAWSRLMKGLTALSDLKIASYFLRHSI